MKILWMVNIVLPRIAKKTGIKAENYGGGWLTGISNALLEEPDNELIVCSPSISINEVKRYAVEEKLTFYLFPEKVRTVYLQETADYLTQILEDVNPDVIHVFGTEYPRTLSMVECQSKTPVIISLTGILSLLKDRYFGSVPETMRRKYTLRYFLSMLTKIPTLYQGYEDFTKRSAYEVRALEKAQHVIGRTTWDYAFVTRVNPKVNYYFCNETLRDSFYNGKWEYRNCENHAIVVPSNGYPIKGFEVFLEGLALLKKKYTDVKVYVPGQGSFSKPKKLKREIAIWCSDYNHYLDKLIKKYELTENIVFCGALDEQGMKALMLKANVFVLPSALENSPNTLGEAMLLGVPSVASCVGGVQNLVSDKEDAFIYPYNEPYMMAYYVGKIFDDQEEAKRLSENARCHSIQIYSREKKETL